MTKIHNKKEVIKLYNEIKNNSLTNEGTTLIAVSGIIENITEKQIQVGLNDIYLTHDILIKETTFIKDYLTNNKVDIEDLKQGDCIYIEGGPAHGGRMGDKDRGEAALLYSPI